MSSSFIYGSESSTEVYSEDSPSMSESASDYQPDTVTRNWVKYNHPNFQPIPDQSNHPNPKIRRPNRVVTRSMTRSQPSLGLEAHVDSDTPPF